ncbi:MAG: hypothetical protein NC307_00475 [Roseburia sp.]|nr:hypothetical protein [Roseburia sp.]
MSGAVKGMAIAGTANMATGALHSTFNIFGNAATKLVYNSQLKALKANGNCGLLANAVWQDCLLFIDTLQQILKDNKEIDMHYDLSSIQESERMINQVEGGKKFKNEKYILCKAFLLYPLNIRFYQMFD